MNIDILDFNLAASSAARLHLERLQGTLRVLTVTTWLLENRRHPKFKQVDDLLTRFRQVGDQDALLDAEIVIDRYGA